MRPLADAEPVPFAERLYHLLRLGEIAAVNELWADKEVTDPAVSRLRSSVDELRPAAGRALKLRLNTDPHSPTKYRCNGPLSNSSDFQKAFNLPDGCPMVRPVDKRVSIW